MRVTIADSTADAYQTFATKQGRPVDQLIEDQLKRFKLLEPGTKATVLGGTVTERLEAALGGLPIKDAADLVTRVENLAAVSFHHIRLDFSANQLAELAHRAERQGKPVEDVIRDTILRMGEQFFWGSGAGDPMVSMASTPPAATPVADTPPALRTT